MSEILDFISFHLVYFFNIIVSLFVEPSSILAGFEGSDFISNLFPDTSNWGIVNNPLLLLFVLIPFVGLGIGLIKRIIKLN